MPASSGGKEWWSAVMLLERTSCGRCCCRSHISARDARYRGFRNTSASIHILLKKRTAAWLGILKKNPSYSSWWIYHWSPAGPKTENWAIKHCWLLSSWASVNKELVTVSHQLCPLNFRQSTGLCRGRECMAQALSGLTSSWASCQPNDLGGSRH